MINDKINLLLVCSSIFLGFVVALSGLKFIAVNMIINKLRRKIKW